MSSTNDQPASPGLPLFQKIRKILRVLVAIFGGGKRSAGKDNGKTPGNSQEGSLKP